MAETPSLALTVLGAGPVGTATAALAASRGHRVTLWSPRGGGTRRLGATVQVHGLLEGSFPVRVAADMGRAVDGADAVLLVVPGHVQPVLLERLARVLGGQPAILVAPAASLSPALLERMLNPRGLVAPVGGLAAPPVAARRMPDGRLWLGAVRPRLWLGAEAGGARLADVASALFGMPVRLLPGLLAASLADMSGLADVAQLLAPHDQPEAQLRLLEALGLERDALAAALRLPLPNSARYFDEIGGVPPLDAQRALGQGGMALSFLATLGAALGVKLPMTEAALRLLEVFAGQSLRGNATLASLGEERVRDLVRFAAAG